MAEYWDIYDKDRNKTGRLAERDVYKLKDTEALKFAEQMNKEIKEQTIIDGSEFDLVE